MKNTSRFIYSSVLALSCLAVSTAYADNGSEDDDDAQSFPQVEKKVKNLKKRVRQLEGEVANLQSQLLPIEVAVDCAAGNTIGNALTAHADGKGLLTITVSGVCNETVTISRDDVLLQGTAGSGIQTPTGVNYGLGVTDNTSNVEVRDLAITGGPLSAVFVNKGAHATLRNIVVQQAATGLMALDNAVLDVSGATVRNNAQGLYAVRGGVIAINNSVIEGNNVGALAFKAGSILLTSTNPEVSTGTGVTVRANATGVVVRSGGFVEIADSVIEGSQFAGVLADTGGSVHLFSALNGAGNRIAGNGTAGLQLNKGSSLVVSDLKNVITANVRGISCHTTTGYVVPQGFVVTGNTSGDILGCAPF